MLTEYILFGRICYDERFHQYIYRYKGNWMSKTVRLIDIANKAGVAPATVSHVLRGTGKNVRISAATKKRVLEISRQLNYTPNLAARQLIENSSKMIGVLIDPRPTEENAVRLAEISNYARSRGYHLMILHETPEPKRIRECLSEFAGRGVEGLICVHHVYPKNPSLVAEIISDNFSNVVFLDKPASDGQSYVSVDYERVGELAVDYLFSKGYENIGLVLPELVWYASPKIRDGYIHAMQRAGRSINSANKHIWISNKDVYSDLTHIDRNTIDKLIEEFIIPNNIQAIITRDDHWAAQLINCLKLRGINVPNDIAVVGCGNWYISRYVQPALTSFDLQLQKVSQTAVDMLIEKLKGTTKLKTQKSIMIEPKLIIRESA